MTTRTPNIGYLVVGLVFIGLAGTWFLAEVDVIDPSGTRWLLPAVLLGAGLIGLSASLTRGLVRRTRTEPLDTTYDEDQPVLDVTTDLDRKLAEHETTGEQQ